VGGADILGAAAPEGYIPVGKRGMQMDKVLPGTTHAVLGFIRQRWADLLQITLLPMAVVVAIVAVQYLAMRPLFASFFDMAASGQVNPRMIGRLMQFYGFIALGGLISMLVFVWLYVRIVRLHELDENYWVGLTGTVIKATLMTAVYGIGVYLLTIVAYVGAAIALMILAAIGSAIASAAGDNGWISVLLAIIAIPAFTALPLFPVWFLCRFMVGLPAVALGRSPDFFSEMWALSKGESWGVPLRLLFGFLIFFVIAIPVTVLAMWPMIAEISELAKTAESGRPTPEMFETMMNRMAPVQAAMLAIQIPFIWYSVLLFAEAYRRFTAKRRP